MQFEAASKQTRIQLTSIVAAKYGGKEGQQPIGGGKRRGSAGLSISTRKHLSLSFAHSLSLYRSVLETLRVFIMLFGEAWLLCSCKVMVHPLNTTHTHTHTILIPEFSKSV